MPSSQSPETTRIRWGRIGAAALLAELAVILIIGVIILVHRVWFAPGQSAEESRAFGEIAGYYAGPAGGAVMTFLFALWVGRKLTANFVLHGLLVGIAGVVLTIAFIFVSKPEHRLMYLVSYVARIGAGYLGGLFMRSHFASAPRLRGEPA